jgi:hypothetical protein
VKEGYVGNLEMRRGCKDVRVMTLKRTSGGCIFNSE